MEAVSSKKLKKIGKKFLVFLIPRVLIFQLRGGISKIQVMVFLSYV